MKSCNASAHAENAGVKTLGEVFKKARESAGLSIRDLSRITGMPTGQISQIETGQRKDPGFSTVERIAQGLSLSLDAIAAAMRQPGTIVKSSLEASAHERLVMLQKAETAKAHIEELIAQLEEAIKKPTIKKTTTRRKKN